MRWNILTRWGCQRVKRLRLFIMRGDIKGPIDPSAGRPDLDFNPAGKEIGFYVTTDRKQAEDWLVRRKHPRITKFVIPNAELAELDIKDL